MKLCQNKSLKDAPNSNFFSQLIYNSAIVYFQNAVTNLKLQMVPKMVSIILINIQKNLAKKLFRKKAKHENLFQKTKSGEELNFERQIDIKIQHKQ